MRKFYWGGFVNGKLDFVYSGYLNDLIPVIAIYKTKKSAKLHYEDVRKITIEEIKR